MIGKKEVIELIKSGFDPESIAFEFGLEIEQVRQCKEEIEQNKVKSQNNKPNLTGHSEMEKMREKYRRLYWGNNRSEIVQTKPLSQEEIELIDTVLATVVDKIKEMEGLGKKEKRDIAQSIYTELKKIPEHQMPLEQAEKFYKLMCSKNLVGLNMNITDRIDFLLNKLRFKSQCQFADAIDFAQDKSIDIKELQRLSNLITSDMLREKNVVFGAVKNKILNKISRIQQQMAVDTMKNNIPDSIKSITSDLVKGKVDIQRANAIIDEEAKRRLANRPQNRFAMTKEDEKKQVFYKISTAIEENAETYPIENPQKTIKQLQELFGGRIEQSIRTVVENLITRKKFNEAKSICEEYIENFTTENLSSRHAPSNNLSSIRSLSNRVRNAEISDIVMTALENQGTPEEERAYLKFIKRLLEEGNINPSVISLGKSKDGRKNITLADVWSEQWTR